MTTLGRYEREGEVRLGDGRTLAFAEFGDPHGRPLVMFHGFPGSRLDGRLGETAARKRGVRLIAPDRPGYGRSDLQPGRRIPDWPADVTALADQLGLGRFAVMGISGGGPYAAACARLIPERLRAAAIVCGVGPFDAPGATRGMSRPNRILFAASRVAPGLLGAVMGRMLRALRRNPERLLDGLRGALPEVDVRVLSRPEVRDVFIASTLEAARQGARAISQEAALYVRPWGFALGEIRMRVLLFQGEVDRNVPASMGRFQAAAIPDCEAHFYPDEGHLSLVVDRQDEILERLTGSD